MFTAGALFPQVLVVGVCPDEAPNLSEQYPLGCELLHGHACLASMYIKIAALAREHASSRLSDWQCSTMFFGLVLIPMETKVAMLLRSWSPLLLKFSLRVPGHSELQMLKEAFEVWGCVQVVDGELAGLSGLHPGADCLCKS